MAMVTQLSQWASESEINTLLLNSLCNGNIAVSFSAEQFYDINC